MFNRHLLFDATVWLSCVFLPAALAAGSHAAEAKLGGLTCERIEGTGVNLIFHSSADVRCTFKDDEGAEQWYMGETGVALGLDLKWTKKETIHLGVLSSTLDFAPEGDFLTGHYGGAKVDVAVGASIGLSVLVGGSGDTIALQPTVQTGEGVGLAAGLGYLNLKPDPLNQARLATPRGEFFPKVLYAGYFNLAYKYRQRPNYAGSDYFSEKAIAAASGAPPAPDAAQAEGLTQAQRAEAKKARGRLMSALRHISLVSIDAARAQVSYDCWLYALAHEAGDDASNCDVAMRTSLAKVEAAVAEVARLRRSETKIAERARQKMLQMSWFMVLFATDSTELDRQAALTVGDALARIERLEEADIYLLGNTDRLGTKQYNLALSERRANSVKAALLAAGLEKAWFVTKAFGEAKQVNFSPHPSDAFSRRVDIVIKPKAFKQEALEQEIRNIKSR